MFTGSYAFCVHDVSNTDPGKGENAMARPRKRIPRGGLEKINRLAAVGATEAQIASALHMSVPTWRKLRRTDPRAAEVFAEARALEEEALVGRLRRVADDPDHPQALVAAMFLLKSRHHYRDQGPVDGAAAEPRVQISLTLPSAMPAERYREAITIEGAVEAPQTPQDER